MIGRAIGARVLMFSRHAGRGNFITRTLLRFWIRGEYVDPQGILSRDAYRRVCADARRVFRRLRAPEDILKIRYRGLAIGPQIYDDIIKYRLKTVEQIDEKVLSSVETAFLVRASVLELLRSRNIVAGAVTHTTCAFDGVLLRSLLAAGKPVYQLFGGAGGFFKLDGWRSRGRVDVPIHCSPPRGLLNLRSGTFPTLLRDASRYFTERELGQAGDYDSARGFSTHKRRLGEDFFAPLNPRLRRLPRVFVFLHCMADDPHVFCGSRFRDYYDWFRQTLRAAAANPNVLWIFKDHPSKRLYACQPDLEKEIRDMGRRNLLYLDSERFSNRGIKELADFVVTCNGSASLEYAAWGVPGCVADRTGYSGLGLVREFPSRRAYLVFLRKLSLGARRPRRPCARAKVAFYLYAKMINQKLSQGLFLPGGSSDIRFQSKRGLMAELGCALTSPGRLGRLRAQLIGLRSLIRSRLRSGATELIILLNGRFRVCPVSSLRPAVRLSRQLSP